MLILDIARTCRIFGSVQEPFRISVSANVFEVPNRKELVSAQPLVPLKLIRRARHPLEGNRYVPFIRNAFIQTGIRSAAPLISEAHLPTKRTTAESASPLDALSPSATKSQRASTRVAFTDPDELVNTTTPSPTLSSAQINRPSRLL